MKNPNQALRAFLARWLLAIGVPILLLGALLAIFPLIDTVRADDPAPGAVEAPTDLITIAQARAQGTGTVTVQGIVTVAAGSYNAGFAIQDSTAGIYVYPSSFVGVSLGDTVILTGTLTSYQCLLEVTPSASNVKVLGSAPVPDPLPFATGAVNEATEGWLVVVTGTVSSKSSNHFNLDDGSGPVYVYVDADTAINLAGIADGDRLRAIGFSSQYASSCGAGWQLQPRQQSDLTVLDATPPTVVSTVPGGGATGISPHKPIYAAFSEALSPSTVNPSTFLLEGPGAVGVSGSASYLDATHTAAFVPAAALSPVTRYTATLTIGMQDTSGNALAAPYVWSFTTGDLDTTQPTVLDRFPGIDAVDVPLGASVVVTFSEALNPATVVAANVTFEGPYGAVPWDAVSYVEDVSQATFEPHGLLLPTSRYTVTISGGVTDWAGNPVAAAVDKAEVSETILGQVLSAGEGQNPARQAAIGAGLPQEAFASAVSCGLDFLALTDHSYAMSDVEWQDVLDKANAATVNGSFVGLRGFEYTQGAEGHINVYNTIRHATRAEVAGCSYCDYTPNLEAGVTVQGFYPWVAITGTQALDGAGTVMQFNHPGWIDFNDWAYHPEVEDVAELEEVGNGWGTSYTFSWDEWIKSLDYGWRVGATNNSDNHMREWGCISPHRTGVVMPALTKDYLLEALRSRRTYASEDGNFDLFFKANGQWMGSELPNTGSMAFEVSGHDPDGEPVAIVQLYTDQGQVLAEAVPNTADFDWDFTEEIAPGVHYFFALVVQADGDRIVSSPVWTMGDEDVRLTDLAIQPSIPTIYNPSLLTALVTNRGSASQSVTVRFDVDGTEIGRVPVTANACTAGPCEDGYASINWQPTATGPVTVTASIEGAPAGDNPDDNSRALHLVVTDEKIPLILIDAGHNNNGVDPHGLPQFVGDLTAHGYNVLFNLDEITPTDLNTETVKLLILNAYGPDQLTAPELAAIGDFVAAGGNLWLNGISDYAGTVGWASTAADRMNGLVGAVETAVGANVPIRFNDDEVLDGNDNNGYPWGIVWHSYPSSATTGVGMNVLKMQSWSLCSLVDRSKQALTQADLGADGFIMVAGDLDTGTGTYGEPNRTHNTDADGAGDAYLYPAGSILPAGAGYDLPGGAGRILFYGDSSDPFNIFAYVAGDGKQNELFNLEAVMWLLGEPLQKQTVAEARSGGDVPINLGRLVWVEGVVTASYGEFFDVLYAQDGTGGITVFAPAGTASGAVEPAFERGDCVRIVGTVDQYQGDTEIQFFETEQIQVLQAGCVPPAELSLGGSVPLRLRTGVAALEESEGWLTAVAGKVTAKTGTDSIWIDDGSGPVRAFLDGYNGTWADVSLGDWVRVVGLASEDGLGQRLRVRNHGAHPLLPDDLQHLKPPTFLPLVSR